MCEGLLMVSLVRPRQRLRLRLVALTVAGAQLAAVALSDLFGYHLVQLGRPHEASLLAGSRISHHITLGGTSAEPGLSAYARSDALPLQAATVSFRRRHRRLTQAR